LTTSAAPAIPAVATSAAVAAHNRANHLFIAFPLPVLVILRFDDTPPVQRPAAAIDMPEAHCRPAPLA
jgi:hypothetical protein